MAYAIGLVLAYPWPTFWPSVGIPVAYLSAPLADATNILADFYGSVAEWLRRKAGRKTSEFDPRYRFSPEC